MDADQPLPVSLQADPGALQAALVAMLHTQAQLLASAVDLGRQQIDCISQGDFETLRHVLGKRQRLADRLAASAAELSRRFTGQATDALSQQQRETYRQQQALALGVYEQLFELEQTAEQLLNQRRTRLAERTAASTTWAQTASAYAQVPPTPHRGARLDLSSSA